MDVLYALVHDVGGPLATYLTRQEAVIAFIDTVEDEPAWRDHLTIERLVLHVADVEPAR